MIANILHYPQSLRFVFVAWWPTRLGVVASSGEARPMPTRCGLNSRRPVPSGKRVLELTNAWLSCTHKRAPTLGHVHN